MNKYFVSDKLNRKLIKTITKSEYELLKNFHPTFKKFENVFDCYFNFCLSKTKLEDFVNHTCKEKELDLETIYSESRFLFLPVFIPAESNKTFYPNAISEEEMINKNVPILPTNQLGNLYRTIEVFRFKHEVVQLLLATKNNINHTTLSNPD